MSRPVLVFQDGAVDELLSVALLTTMPRSDIDYLGCFVVNGDCLAWPTVEAQLKILGYMKTLDPSLPTDTFVVPVGSRAVNAFPWTYRQYSMMTNMLPVLNMGTPPAASPAPATPTDRLAAVAARVQELAATADEKFTLLSLGPLTPIAELMSVLGPDFIDRVEDIVWMGGAIPPVTGNVDPGVAIGANPNAEWNAYWDPYAVDTVFRSGVTVRLFPLNVTNEYPIGVAFFEKYIYPNVSHPMIRLAGEMYSTVAFEDGYCFWDTVTTAYLGKPALFSFQTEQLVINTDFTSSNFGSITKSPSGSSIEVAQMAAGVDAFYEYYVEQLKSVAFS